MFARIWILMWAGLVITQAEEKSPTHETALARVAARSESLDSEIESAQKDLAARLHTTRPTPEQRAILIDRWQQDTRILRDEAKAARAALAAHQAATAPTVVPTKTAIFTPEITANPLLADIHEVEADVMEFQKSLETSKLTAEQRAIQVERFHQINRAALEELEALKLQSVQQLNPSQANLGNAAGETVADSPAPSGRAGFLQAELGRVATQLSKITPEDRAIYLETHAATLAAMGKELSLTAAISSTASVSAPNLKPATPQKPSTKTDP